MESRCEGPFSFADVKPYALPESLEDLRGPEHGPLALSKALAWSGRRVFDLDDDYDRAAAYKIIMEEGGEEDLRRLVNGRLLQRHWQQIRVARRVRALWEERFAGLRRAA